MCYIGFTLQVIFCFTSRILVQIGSCINPFIYATTVPGFKKMVNNFSIRYGCKKGEVSQLTQMGTTDNWSSNTKVKSNPALIKGKKLLDKK